MFKRTHHVNANWIHLYMHAYVWNQFSNRNYYVDGPYLVTFCCLLSYTAQMHKLKFLYTQVVTHYQSPLTVNHKKAMYRAPQLCLAIEPRMINKFLAHSPISFEHMSFGCLFLDLHLTTHHLEMGVRLI